MKPIMRKSLTALGLSLVTSAALAADDWNCNIQGSSFSSCFYLGAGVGASKLKPAENIDWKVDSDKDSAWQIYAGYHITKDWFVDIAYADLGDAKMKSVFPYVESETIGYTVPSAMAGYYLNFFDMPVEPFVRFGLASIEDSPSGNLETDKQNSVSFAWGAGLDWRFAKHFKLRGVVETYDKDAAIASVSVAYIFGEAKVAAKPVAPAPKAEPKPEPKPEPVVEAKPEPAPPAQSAEVKKLFSGSLKGVNFKAGSAELLPESRTTLMDAAAVLKEYPDLQVDVNAYTCNDGSKEFNLKLSQQRADKVKSFFVEQGVDSSRLKATGYGKDYPLVPNTSEENKAKNRRVELKQRNS